MANLITKYFVVSLLLLGCISAYGKVINIGVVANSGEPVADAACVSIELPDSTYCDAAFLDIFSTTNFM